MTEFKSAATPLTAGCLEACAASLSVGLPEIWTVLMVETRGWGFFKDGRPAILYERHIFDARTKGRFRTPGNEEICSPHAGGYAGGSAEYGRLGRALLLDRTEALKSTSWGIGQIMGFHAEALGYGTVEQFVAMMVESEDDQLTAFTRFILHNKLDEALRGHNWREFAKRYNGPAYGMNQYDQKLDAAYLKLSSGKLPDLTVREGQVLLTLLGFEAGSPDGSMGARTRAALHEFQRKHELPLTELFDEATLRVLREKHASLS
jgi:N-acetylmuramidase/Putative peptidoglycan binding domain